MRTIVMRNSTYTPESVRFHPHFLKAVGYLSQWAALSNSYEYVEISIHSDGDIAAAYHPTQDAAKRANRPAFFMMGILNKEVGSYSFHS